MRRFAFFPSAAGFMVPFGQLGAPAAVGLNLNHALGGLVPHGSRGIGSVIVSITNFNKTHHFLS